MGINIIFIYYAADTHTQKKKQSKTEHKERTHQSYSIILLVIVWLSCFLSLYIFYVYSSLTRHSTMSSLLYYHFCSSLLLSHTGICLCFLHYCLEAGDFFPQHDYFLSSSHRTSRIDKPLHSNFQFSFKLFCEIVPVHVQDLG